MKEPRIYVDFNEMVESNLVLLSKTDFKEDSDGNLIELKEGMVVKIYENSENENNEEDNLIAEGTVELNTYKDWASAAKWNCRINEKGIHPESEER